MTDPGCPLESGAPVHFDDPRSCPPTLHVPFWGIRQIHVPSLFIRLPHHLPRPWHPCFAQLIQDRLIPRVPDRLETLIFRPIKDLADTRIPTRPDDQHVHALLVRDTLEQRRDDKGRLEPGASGRREKVGERAVNDPRASLDKGRRGRLVYLDSPAAAAVEDEFGVVELACVLARGDLEPLDAGVFGSEVFGRSEEVGVQAGGDDDV